VFSVIQVGACVTGSWCFHPVGAGTFNFTNKSVLTNFSLFYKSGLLHTVLLLFSSSVYSVGMLCINSYSHSALLQLIFLFFSAFHLTKSSLQEDLKRKKGAQNSNSKELEQMITKLKIQVEKDKRIEEELKEQLEERDMIIGSLESKIVILRKYLQKKNMQNNSKVLDEIISSQRPHHDKSGLEYNQKENSSSSKTIDQETK